MLHNLYNANIIHNGASVEYIQRGKPIAWLDDLDNSIHVIYKGTFYHYHNNLWFTNSSVGTTVVDPPSKVVELANRKPPTIIPSLFISDFSLTRGFHRQLRALMRPHTWQML